MNLVLCVHEIMFHKSPSCTVGSYFLRLWVHVFPLSLIDIYSNRFAGIKLAEERIKRVVGLLLCVNSPFFFFFSLWGVIWELKPFVMLEAKHRRRPCGSTAFGRVLLLKDPETIERAFFRCYPLRTLQTLHVPPSFQQWELMRDLLPQAFPPKRKIL